MKIECPVCHVQGILEQRGNSARVLHYRGIFNGKRLYEKHSDKMGVMGVNGNKLLGVKEADNGIILGKEAPPKGLEPLTDWLTASRSTGLSYGGTA